MKKALLIILSFGLIHCGQSSSGRKINNGQNSANGGSGSISSFMYTIPAHIAAGESENVSYVVKVNKPSTGTSINVDCTDNTTKKVVTKTTAVPEDLLNHEIDAVFSGKVSIQSIPAGRDKTQAAPVLEYTRVNPDKTTKKEVVPDPKIYSGTAESSILKDLAQLAYDMCHTS